jgi:hypothetical protein
MNEKFKSYIESLEPAYRRLLGMRASTIANLPKEVPEAGVYLISENGNPIFVGRTNRMRSRLKEQCRLSSNHNTASLAFKIARKATIHKKATYTSDNSREALEKDASFKAEFEFVKQRLSDMEVKFIEETDPLRQCLLQIYVALATGAKYNDFDTH